jgi:hypothetical protein
MKHKNKTVPIRKGSSKIIIEIFLFIVFTFVNIVLVVLNGWSIIPIIAGAIWGISGLLFVLRDRKTNFKDLIKPFPVEEVKYYDDHGRVFYHTPRPPLAPEQRASRIEFCRKYIEYKRDHPDVPDEVITQQILHVSPSKLYEALQSWRIGDFDDRPWYRKVWDRLDGRAYSDIRRYLPPR